MRIFKTAFFLLIAISAFTIIYQAKAGAAEAFVANEDEIITQAQEVCGNIRAAAPAIISDQACSAEHGACVENFLDLYGTRVDARYSVCVFTGNGLQTKCPTRQDFLEIMGRASRDHEERIGQACQAQDASVDGRDLVLSVARTRCEQLLESLNDFPRNDSPLCSEKLDRCTADLISALNPDNRRIENIDLSNDNMRNGLQQVRRGIAEACTTQPEKEIVTEVADTDLVAEKPAQATGGCTLAGQSGSLANLLGLLILALPVASLRRR